MKDDGLRRALEAWKRILRFLDNMGHDGDAQGTRPPCNVCTDIQTISALLAEHPPGGWVREMKAENKALRAALTSSARETAGAGLIKAATRALECLDRFSYFRDSGVKLVADSLRAQLTAERREGESRDA